MDRGNSNIGGLNLGNGSQIVIAVALVLGLVFGWGWT